MSTDTISPPEEREDTSRPPREDLARALYDGGVIIRSSPVGTMPTMHGHFAVFNQWTEINSMWEGKFMEQIAPGAFTKTFRESRTKIRALFQHGHDPQVGDKPMGPVELLEEDTVGAAYEVPLLDTSYNRDILPGLEAGLYGASFRFQVMREQIVEEPDASPANPNGLPERTITEARVMEFGPVTFPAYDGATAGVRSLTGVLRDITAVAIATPVLLDEERLARAREFLTRPIPFATTIEDEERSTAPPEHDAEPAKAHLSPGRRGFMSVEGIPEHWVPNERKVPTSWNDR